VEVVLVDMMDGWLVGWFFIVGLVVGCNDFVFLGFAFQMSISRSRHIYIACSGKCHLRIRRFQAKGPACRTKSIWCCDALRPRTKYD